MSVVAEDVIWMCGPALEQGWPTTLDVLLSMASQRLGEHPVLVDCHGRPWAWPEILSKAASLAATWALQRGDRVLISGDNGPDHLIAECAAWHCGAIVVPLAAHIPGPQRATLIDSIEPRLILDQAAGTMPDACHLGRAPWQPIPVTADDPALILFTSGSSGQAKGVVLSQANICSQQAAFAQLWPTIDSSDRLVSYLPWHHSFGALAERLWALLSGATMHLVPGGGHDSQALLDTIRRVRPSIFMSVPKLHHLVAQAQVLDRSWVRWAFSAGAPLGHSTEEAYTAAGIPVVEGWGLTEASPSVTITRPGQRRGQGLVGSPIPGVALGIAEDGEILVRGPGVMLGYWRNPTATAAALSSPAGERVLHTGDCGTWTADGLLVEGRKDQQIKHPNGEKVPLQRLEGELLALPQISQVAICVDEGVQGLCALVVANRCEPQKVVEAVRTWNATITVPWWRIRRLAHYRGELSVSNGLLTASHKLARRAFVESWLQARDTGSHGGVNSSGSVWFSTTLATEQSSHADIST